MKNVIRFCQNIDMATKLIKSYTLALTLSYNVFQLYYIGLFSDKGVIFNIYISLIAQQKQLYSHCQSYSEQ